MPRGFDTSRVALRLESTVDFPSRECDNSVQGEKGSVLASSSDSIQVPMAIQPISQHSGSDLVETTSPHRKVTSIRPRPFIGQRKNLDSIEQSRSLHIGRGLMFDDDNSRSRKMRK